MNGRALLAWNLRLLRTERSLSQERLAADAAVDRAWVSELEREQGNTSIDLLDRLAVALDVPIGALFAEPNPDAARPKPLRSGRKAKT
jgi:transcriptional regulator with XRE-family HTH domain